MIQWMIDILLGDPREKYHISFFANGRTVDGIFTIRPRLEDLVALREVLAIQVNQTHKPADITAKDVWIVSITKLSKHRWR
jgi:hypothetical protein